MKKKECPKCLGLKEVFEPNDDDLIVCNFCQGDGVVDEDRADSFDPIDSEEFMYNDDEGEVNYE